MPNDLSYQWELAPGVRAIDIDGYPMAFLERGGGAPLLLVHGSLSDCRVWEMQMGPFSAAYRTIAVSLRHAWPEPWDGSGAGFSVRQHAGDLAAFITTLQAGPVHLLGHSRGGAIALKMAGEHPELLLSLILSDPAPLAGILPQTPEAAAEALRRRQFVTAALERIQNGEVDEGLEIFVDAVIFPGCWKMLPEPARQIRRDNAWSLKSLVEDALTPFTPADVARIAVPVLLVGGAKSPPIYAMMHHALQKFLPQAKRLTIPDVSHAMARENPAAFNAAVLEFLATPP